MSSIWRMWDPMNEEEEKINSTDEERSKEEESVPDQPPEENIEEDSFDEDEKALFEKLLKKLEDADELGKELDSDLGDFSDRVENVMDSVERIEKMERLSLEGLVYKDEQEKEEAVGPEGEPPTEAPPETIDQETSVETDEITVQPPVEKTHIYIPTESPYADIKEGRVEISDDEEEPSGVYGSDVDSVLQKLARLIEIKIKKQDLEAGKILFNMAVNIGANSDFFRENFINLAEQLGMDTPKEDIIKEVEEAEKRGLGIDINEETTVLDPELAGEISLLQKKAANAIQHLDRLIENTVLTQEDFKSVKESYLRASEDFRNKMFHKSYKTALEALETIKNQVQDNIDNRIQENLYKAKEMYEDLSKDEGIEQEKIEELKLTFDRAMKAYLTNEFEKANLLAKRVINSILDLTETEGEPMREKVEELKKRIRKLQELKIHEDEVQELNTTLRKAEDLIDRRDSENATKLLSRIDELVEEAAKKGEVYSSAKEMEIRLTNKVDRLKDSGYDLDSIRKKLGFLQNYLNNERYEDVLKLGGQIEEEIGSLEIVKIETETNRIMGELEEIIVKVDDLENPSAFKNEYSKIKVAFQNKEHESVIELGTKLIDDIRIKLKTRIVTKGRKLAKAVIESKVNLMKLRSINTDISGYERDIRKAKNHIKEGRGTKGIEELEKINMNMKDIYKKNVSFMKDYLNIYRDSLEVLMDRHKEEPVMYYIRSRHVPLIRKMAELGRYQKALETYKDLESHFTELSISDDKKEDIESDLTEVKFEIYKRKEEGKYISEPLSLYTLAQKRFSEGNPVPTEYLVEVSKRFCETFMPL